VTDLKVSESATVFLPIDIHNNFGIPNWAGYVVGVHIADGNEVSLLPSMQVGAGGNVVNPVLDLPDSTAASAMTMGWAWVPSAAGTGTNAPSSVNIPILRSLVLGVKGMVIDSLPDVTVSAWNIRHLAPAQTSDTVVLHQSDLVWAPSSWIPIPTNFELPFWLTPSAPSAHWVHMPFTASIHFTAPAPGSNLIATQAGKFTVDVPEPATGGLLLACGCLALAGHRVARRRRIRMS
jgi:hypothetical protein